MRSVKAYGISSVAGQEPLPPPKEKAPEKPDGYRPIYYSGVSALGLGARQLSSHLCLLQ